MFTSFFSRTSPQTTKTKRKWQSSEAVDEEEVPIDNLQTPPRKRSRQAQPPQDNRTPFGKVSSWIKETAVSIYRSFADKYNLRQGGADNDDSSDISPPVYQWPTMKPANYSRQGTSSQVRGDQDGPSLSPSPTYRGGTSRDDSLSGRKYGRASVTRWRRTSREEPRCSLHDPSILRPRLYDPSRYESDKTNGPLRSDSWSTLSPRYLSDVGHTDVVKHSSGGKKKANDSEKSLGYQPPKTNRHVTMLDSVVRLAEREEYMKLLAHFTSRKQTTEESCSIGSQSIDRDSMKHGGTDLGRTRKSRHDQSLLGLCDPMRSTRTKEKDGLKPIAVRVSPSKPSPKTVDLSRTMTTDVTMNVFESVAKSRRPRRTTSVDIFDDGWIQKWKENLSTENIEKERQIAKEKLKLESLRKEENEKFQQLSEEVKARMQGKRLVIEEKVDSFPELTQEMNCVVDKALGRGAPNEYLVEIATGRLTRADIATLGQQNWLNDEVVNAYFQLLADRSKKKGPKVHSFNTFFYPKLIKTGHASLRRWTKKVIDLKTKVISYYDSLKGENKECLQALRDYLCAESLDKKKQTLDLTGWKCDTPKNIPEQLNGCDCGVFVCKYAEYISRRVTFDFTQYNMPYFRRRMIYEILSKKLL